MSMRRFTPTDEYVLKNGVTDDKAEATARICVHSFWQGKAAGDECDSWFRLRGRQRRSLRSVRPEVRPKHRGACFRDQARESRCLEDLGEKRPADLIGNAAKVMKIQTETFQINAKLATILLCLVNEDLSAESTRRWTANGSSILAVSRMAVSMRCRRASLLSRVRRGAGKSALLIVSIESVSAL